MVNLDKKNIKNIITYCELNKIENIELFANKCLKKGYDIEVYGLLGNNESNIIEKEVISDIAVSGVYFIKNASKFIEASKSVINNNIRQKGEFYVSSALKIMIEKGLKLGIYYAESIMLGTPEELQKNIDLI